MSTVLRSGLCPDASRLVRTALVVVVGLLTVLPSTARAQEESKDGELQTVPIYAGYLQVGVSNDAGAGTLILTRELEGILGKTIQVRHRARNVFPEPYVLQTLLVTPSGRTIGQCISGSATIMPGEPMSFPVVCLEGSLTETLHKAGVETLTVEKIQWIDGRPVNMGLWARENLDKSSLALSIVVTTERHPDGEIAGGGTLVMKLSYPPEHGIVN
jgi:hypothetical protein